LHKIILSAEELRSLDVGQIRALAQQPRLLEVTDATGFLSRVEVAKILQPRNYSSACSASSKN